jgi:hypothetical protein
LDELLNQYWLVRYRHQDGQGFDGRTSQPRNTAEMAGAAAVKVIATRTQNALTWVDATLPECQW